MKSLKIMMVAGVIAGVVALSQIARADDQKLAGKLIPYPLKTCVVSGENPRRRRSSGTLAGA